MCFPIVCILYEESHSDCVCLLMGMSMCTFQEDDMPEEVNIDDLIDLPNDEERVKKLQVTWMCSLKMYVYTCLCRKSQLNVIVAVFCFFK